MFATKNKILANSLGMALLISFLFIAFQIEKPSSWTYSVSKKEAKVGETVDLIFNAKIQDGWYLYSSDVPVEGPMPFTFKLKPNDTYEVVGGIKPIHAKRKHDDIWDGDVTYFIGTAEFRQTVRILKENPVIEGRTNFQTCTTDAVGKCVPGGENFKFTDIKVGVGVATVTATVKDSVKKNPLLIKRDSLRAKMLAQKDSLSKLKNLTKADSSQLASLSNIENTLPTDTTIAETAAVAPTSSLISGGDVDLKGLSLWQIILAAFVAGLIATLTPCVYPMIPMTVAFFTKRAESRKKGVQGALIYGASIVVIFTLIGTLISYIFGAAAANFISTHWLPNIFIFVILLIFGISFLGFFELVLPNSIVNKMDAKADQGGFTGIFFMAFTLVLVSFSCTAPIVGAAAILSSQGDFIKPVLAMISFSTAFALPFVLFAMSPKLLQSLPKSGGWLNTVKVVLGFLEIALALKFLSIPDQTYHWGILSRPVYLVIWIVIFALTALNILGVFRMPHDSKLNKIGIGRWALAFLFLGFSGYLVTGLMKNPLTTISGLLPPEEQKTVAEVKTVTLAPDGSNPRFNNIFHLPHGLKGFFDFKEAVAYSQKVKKPIFIDFTGHGCVNCREMEAKVWADTSIQRRLQNDYVLVALYVDDKTELPKNEWYISKDDKQEKTTVGEQNFDFQIVKYNSNSQPHYCLVRADGSVIIKPRDYNLDIPAFAKFLDEGKEKFEK